MKKILSLLLIISVSIFSLLAVDNPIPEGMKDSVRLSVTTTNTVYLGVSSQRVVSSIFPSSSIINEEKFYYDPKAMLWYSPSLFFFVISFVNVPLRISISIPSILNGTGTNTGSLQWIPSGDLSIGTDTNGYVRGDQTSGDQTSGYQTIELITESSDVTGTPRVYCWEVKMAIPGETVIKGAYKNTFTLEVKSGT